MVIRDFDVVRIPGLPVEADSILVVDPDAVLPLPIATEPLKAVSGRNRPPNLRIASRAGLGEGRADPDRRLRLRDRRDRPRQRREGGDGEDLPAVPHWR